MLKWLFRSQDNTQRVEEDTKKGFEKVREEMGNITRWIKHLDSQRDIQGEEINEIKESLSSLKGEIEGLKNMVSLLGNLRPGGGFKTPRQMSIKQVPDYGVGVGVQTAVQTPNLSIFTVNERALLWILLNTDMRLSYEDLATMLGKEKSTIRSQINTIRQKNGEMIEEIIEKNGKKRVFVPEGIKEIIQKKSRVGMDRKKGKNTEKETDI
ncbi:hypothetical protein COU57_00710 [Candidatus Pacearchaeota archaeon CG10_big_fil_rev_8_21_14_0_10_32_14]|nr:MAG: hypothetical protein COU57_00710 [Candidatus Pacearchaeota archaeon CG10_big_fil_rev_8_21_14_0_10_32_14]